MPDVSGYKFITKDPTAYAGSVVGTAAGTSTLSNDPCFFKGITVGIRPASGTIIIYDSVGTSGTVLGTITLGTQTFSDPPPMYEYDIATRNALTVSVSANVGATVMFK